MELLQKGKGSLSMASQTRLKCGEAAGRANARRDLFFA
jgi:hypothetical protein